MVNSFKINRQGVIPMQQRSGSSSSSAPAYKSPPKQLPHKQAHSDKVKASAVLPLDDFEDF